METDSDSDDNLQIDQNSLKRLNDLLKSKFIVATKSKTLKASDITDKPLETQFRLFGSQSLANVTIDPSELYSNGSYPVNPREYEVSDDQDALVRSQLQNVVVYASEILENAKNTQIDTKKLIVVPYESKVSMKGITPKKRKPSQKKRRINRLIKQGKLKRKFRVLRRKF